LITTQAHFCLDLDKVTLFCSWKEKFPSSSQRNGGEDDEVATMATSVIEKI
jgi:hypothetical protein